MLSREKKQNMRQKPEEEPEPYLTKCEFVLTIQWFKMDTMV